jgi:hypothetical protein
MGCDNLRSRLRPQACIQTMRWISTSLLLASLLIGLAHVAYLPPFEGFDEAAHYSYIEQIAKKRALPRMWDSVRQDAADVVGYFDGPLVNPKQQYLIRRLRYHNLFAADAEVIETARRMVKEPRNPPATGEAGTWVNGETQHPPFYYALLAPAYLFSERWSLVAQLTLLRGLSYVAAWLSLCLAVFVAAKTTFGTGRAMIVAPALWPFVFPGWFPEMARLGNDSLVALLVSCALAVVICTPIRRWSTWVLLGVICGFGALTKSTFLPFLAVIALLLLHRTWRWNGSSWQFLGFLAIVLAVAGWWYFQYFGLLGGYTSELEREGGFIAGLTEHFSVGALAQIIPAVGLSFLWTGSSHLTSPFAAMVPLVAMSALIGSAYLYGLRSNRMHPLVLITPLTLGFWTLAILYPSLVYMALYGRVPLDTLGWGGFPGYYSHSMAPALAPVIGIALTTIGRHWVGRATFCLLLSYNVLFLFGVSFMQFLYFTGCNSDGNFVRFSVASTSACWKSDWQRLIGNLDVLAYPSAALWLAAGGAIALGCGASAILAFANSPIRSSRAIQHCASASLS